MSQIESNSEHVTIHPDGRVEIFSIYPKIREFYHKNNLDYVPTAEDRAHALFDQQLAGETVTKILSVYRIRKGFSSGKEYLYWFETVNGHDRFGNRIQKRFVRGRYDNPIGEYRFDTKTQAPKCTGIQALETTYDIPFDIKTLDKLAENELIDEKTTFILDTGNLRYAVSSFDDFRNLSFEDLLNIGRTGLRPEQREEVLKNRERKRTGQQD